MNPDAVGDVRQLIALWGTMHDAIIRHVAEECGEGRLKRALYEPLRQLGKAAAQSQAATAAEIGRAIMGLETLWEIEGRLVEENPQRFVRQVTYCPWSHFAPLSCRVFGWWVEGLCQGMNSRFVYRLDRLIPEGAQTCQWSISEQDAVVTGA